MTSEAMKVPSRHSAPPICAHLGFFMPVPSRLSGSAASPAKREEIHTVGGGNREDPVPAFRAATRLSP